MKKTKQKQKPTRQTEKRTKVVKKIVEAQLAQVVGGVRGGPCNCVQ